MAVSVVSSVLMHYTGDLNGGKYTGNESSLPS